MAVSQQASVQKVEWRFSVSIVFGLSQLHCNVEAFRHSLFFIFMFAILTGTGPFGAGQGKINDFVTLFDILTNALLTNELFNLSV